jgi:SAM-dependent methyltransferase
MNHPNAPRLKPDRAWRLALPTLRPAARLYLERLFRWIRVFFPCGTKVLDAGCGCGQLSEVLSSWGCQVTGLDLECHADWERVGKQGVDFCKGSAECLPFGNAFFDAVLVKDAFHHMQNPKIAMAELQRVVRPGGPVVVIEANRFNPVFYLHLTLLEGHEHFSRPALKRFLKAADPGYQYAMAESRCLPWDAPWLLGLLAWGEEVLESARVLNPWLTYQVAVVRGKGVSG